MDQLFTLCIEAGTRKVDCLLAAVTWAARRGHSLAAQQLDEVGPEPHTGGDGAKRLGLEPEGDRAEAGAPSDPGVLR